MNIAPLLRKTLCMQTRCENAVSGFVALDLFSILAAQRACQMRLPAGSTYMAQQTMQNLQCCALAAIVISVTTNEELGLWRHGNCRVSELAIEQYFGQLRQQSPTAQFGCRGFWQAGARSALHMSKQLSRESPPKQGAKPLTDEELLVSRAFCR